MNIETTLGKFSKPIDQNEKTVSASTIISDPENLTHSEIEQFRMELDKHADALNSINVKYTRESKSKYLPHVGKKELSKLNK